MLKQLLKVSLILPRFQNVARIGPIASMRFERSFSSELTSNWPESIKTFLSRENIQEPTEIQERTLPIAMENKDLVGIARTGSGKTLAFVIPAVIKILKSRQEASEGGANDLKKASCLVLAPTRELAVQTAEVFDKFRNFNIKSLVLVGGASRDHQITDLERRNQDVLIATPGRLIDLVTSGLVDLSAIKYLVLDEADRMLDMGFEPQIRKILERIPSKHQTLMWSATWPEEIKALAEEFMTDYNYIAVDSATLKANPNIEQKIIVGADNKIYLLIDKLVDLQEQNPKFKCLIFTNTKRFASRLLLILTKNRIKGVCIHGDRSQRQRDDAIRYFKKGLCNVMVATDVAARGLDINDIDVVINLEFPSDIENYIHRIGRTARHDKKGVSITFMNENDANHASKLIKILRETNQEVPEELETLAQQWIADRGTSRQRQSRQSYSNLRRGQYDQDRRGSYNRINIHDEDEDFDQDDDYKFQRDRRSMRGGYVGRRDDYGGRRDDYGGRRDNYNRRDDFGPRISHSQGTGSSRRVGSMFDD